MASSTTATQPVAAPAHGPKMHYCHNRGDVSLRSSDGIVFKVESWRLARGSTVFKNMLELAPPLNDNNKRR
ncbi:hypothetical protein IAR55_006203 [Kwoniella newhampshirensis]|uniref:SKP1 component POZ domain-containing protein n=1 Tax=Kwoniella newhampshirensis TaxID=1651941 RepID=A0AAW0YFI4_9TREE